MRRERALTRLGSSLLFWTGESGERVTADIKQGKDRAQEPESEIPDHGSDGQGGGDR